MSYTLGMAAKRRVEAALKMQHKNNGNCFGDDSAGESFVFKCKKCGAGNLCDVCHRHDQPRGECDACPACHECTPSGSPR